MTDIPKDTFTPELQDVVPSKSILMITADKVEDLEFFYPYYRFIEEGYKVDVATPDGGEFKAKNGYKLPGTKKIIDVSAQEYDLLYIPGGKAPAELKELPEAIEITRVFFDTGKPIAAICHGPQLLAQAGIINGVSIAAWPEVQEEVEAAGGIYVNEKMVSEGQFITARWPADLPYHLAEVMDVLAGTDVPTRDRALRASAH